MILASIELGRRAYEFYNQYISQIKEQKKNIIQPDIKLFNNLVIKSLEEFNIQINKELFSEYLYLAMKACFQEMNLQGFVNWFDVQVQ